MPYRNPEEGRAKRREHYRANKAYYDKKAREARVKNRKRNYRFVNRYKLLRGCWRCGYRECVTALQFHHLGEKDRMVSRMVSDAHSLAKIKREIRKCIVLCANCHIFAHADELVLKEVKNLRS